MRLVIKKSIQLCLRTLVFSIVLRHSNYNNGIISMVSLFFWDTLYIQKFKYSHFQATCFYLCIIFRQFAYKANMQPKVPWKFLVLSCLSVWLFCLFFLSGCSVSSFCLAVLSLLSVWLFCLVFLSGCSVTSFCLAVLSRLSVWLFCHVFLSGCSVSSFCLAVLSRRSIRLFYFAVLFRLSVVRKENAKTQ